MNAEVHLYPDLDSKQLSCLCERTEAIIVNSLEDDSNLNLWDCMATS